MQERPGNETGRRVTRPRQSACTAVPRVRVNGGAVHRQTPKVDYPPWDGPGLREVRPNAFTISNSRVIRIDKNQQKIGFSKLDIVKNNFV